jgi:uncharacterized membrane protein
MNKYNRVQHIFQAKKWLIEGWVIFKSKPLSWIGMMLFFVIFNGLSINIPFGKYIVALIAPCLIGGIYLALDSHNRGNSIGFKYIFGVFKEQILFKQCLIIGAIGMAVMVINTLIYKMPGSDYMLTSYSGNRGSSSFLVNHFSLGNFLTGIVTLCWSLAVLFGVPLVVIKKMQAIDALKLSVIAILVNILPLMVLYFSFFVLIFIAIIPFGLGLIIVIPVIFCTLYCVFNTLFSKEEI